MDLISLFQTFFYVCLVCGFIFLIISVILFFAFDIKTIFNYKTGRAKTKTMKAMLDTYDRTGRLHENGKSLSSELSGKKKRASKASGKKKINAIYENYSVQEEQNVQPVDRNPVINNDTSAPVASYIPSQPPQVGDGSEGTTALYSAGQTEVLQQQVQIPPYRPGEEATEQLSGGGNSVSAAAKTGTIRGSADIHFKVVKKLVVVHTNEIIK